MAAITPLIYKDGQHVTAPAGSVLDDDLIDKSALISDDADNALSSGSDGKLFVTKAATPDDLVSAVTGNQLSIAADSRLFVPAPAATDPNDLVSAVTDNQLTVAADSKLFVPKPSATDPADLVSAVNGNQITVAADGKLFTAAPSVVDPANFVSAVTGNQLSIAADSKLFVPAVDVPDPGDQISTDVGNIIQEGTDDKFFARAVSTDADNLITRGSDNAALLTASDAVSAGTAENLLKVNATDKRLVVSKTDVVSAVEDALTIVSDDTGNLLSKGSDGGAFLSEDDIPDELTAGAGITIANGRVSVNAGTGLAINVATNELIVDTSEIQTISLSASEQILALTSNGVLSATLVPQYDALTGNLTLYGKNSEVVGRVYIPGAASALKTVEVVTNPTGYAAGTYFKFTWTTVSGDTSVYVQVPSTSTINAGNGIEATSSGDIITIAAKVKTDGGLLNSAAGLEADFDKVAAKSDLDALTDRVSDAEDDITALKGRMDTAESDIDDLDDRVDALELGSSSITVITGSFDPSSLTDGTGALVPASDLLS